MKRFTGSLFALSLLAATACADDDDAGGAKGRVDEAALDADGVTVTLNGNTASVDVPFSEPVPSNPADEALNEALDTAASLSIRSDVTGTTANLADGEWVDGDPSGPGEFNWALNEDRDMLTFTFYNETTAGTTLKTDRTYTASVSISTNAYVENLASTAVAVTVQ